MNTTALNKIKETLQLAAEFIKDENTYAIGGYITNTISCSLGNYAQASTKKKSDDIRAKAESEASKLERQEKCAALIQECLTYLKEVSKFEQENKQN